MAVEKTKIKKGVPTNAKRLKSRLMLGTDLDQVNNVVNNVVDIVNGTTAFPGDLTVTGNTTLNGNTVIGSAATDTLTINATVVGFSGTSSLVFEGGTTDDAFETTVNVTNPSADRIITFPDNGVDGTVILSANTGLTEIASSRNNAQAILINASAGGIDITAAGAATEDIDVVNTAGSVVITGGEAIADAVDINASNAAGGIDIDAGTGGITVDTTGATGVISIDCAATTGNSNLTHNGGAASDLNIASTLGSLNISAGEAIADAVNIDSAAGGIDVDAALQINVTSSQNAADAIRLNASAGGIDIDAAGAAGEDIVITNTAGSVIVESAESIADAVTIRGTGYGSGIDITTGGGNGGNGGILDITTGSATDVDNQGGALNIISGNGFGAGQSGDISITGGTAGATGTGGSLTLKSGISAGAGGTAGAVTLDTGAIAGGAVGAMNIGSTNAGTITIGRSGQAANINSNVTITKSAAGVALTLDADTTDATADVIDIDLGVNSASVNAIDISTDIKTALSAAEVVNSINIDTNSLAADADTSSIRGLNVIASAVSTSRADIKGIFVTTDGIMDRDDTIYGIQVDENANQSASVEQAGLFVDIDSTVNNAGATNYGILIDTRDVTDTSSSEIAGIKMFLGSNTGTGKGLAINAAVVAHAAGNLIEIDADAANIVAGSLIGTSTTIDETVAGTDGTAIKGSLIDITGFATGQADLIGSEIRLNGTKNDGDTTQGIRIDTETLTLNHASETFAGINIDADTIVNTASASVRGIDISMPPVSTGSAPVGVNVTMSVATQNAFATNALVTSTANAGAAGAGTVTVKEVGDGRDKTVILTLTNFIVGALDGAAAAKGIGNIVYAFPAGQHFELVYSLSSIVLTAVGTAVATDTGLGSVIASGVVAVLSGTPTFEDRLTGQTINTAAGGGAAVSALTAATAGIGTGISLNIAGSVKNVFLNSAGTWNVDNTGNLTATGTIVLKATIM